MRLRFPGGGRRRRGRADRALLRKPFEQVVCAGGVRRWPMTAVPWEGLHMGGKNLVSAEAGFPHHSEVFGY